MVYDCSELQHCLRTTANKMASQEPDLAFSSTSSTDYGYVEVPCKVSDVEHKTPEFKTPTLNSQGDRPVQQIVGSEMHGRTITSHYKIIIVGESGLGKTTATDCLLHDLRRDPPSSCPESSGIAMKTLKITPSDPVLLRCDTGKVCLTIVDTPGYGDNLDARDDFCKIKDYIESQYVELYKGQVIEGKNPLSHDSLVTCCLYFIAPHHIKENDIVFMKEVGKLLPIVPVIAKADTMTVNESNQFRKEVGELLEKHDIPLYDWKLPCSLVLARTT